MSSLEPTGSPEVRQDRIRAILLGLAVGDALGSPLEYMSEAQIQIKHGTVDRMIGGGWLDLRPGEGTDATQLMLVLGKSLADQGAFQVEEVVTRYLEWYRTNPIDIETMTRASLALLDQGTGRDEASREARREHGEKSASNGTLARGVPLALVKPEDIPWTIRTSLEESRITHDDPLAGSAAAAFHLLLARVLVGENDRQALLQRTSEALFDNQEGAENVLPDPIGRRRDQLRPGDGAIDSLEVALWFFFHTESFRDCLVGAIHLGGESGTIGALAGALAGGYYGIEAIPAEWLNNLQDRNRIDHLARRLARGDAGAA